MAINLTTQMKQTFLRKINIPKQTKEVEIRIKKLSSSKKKKLLVKKTPHPDGFRYKLYKQ